jgi:arabinofuranosyltransferase
MSTRKPIFNAFIILLLAILVYHISTYYFLTDDAFISFRYAVNFADGNGLVFNIGERVEGYTNFLWVIILSIFSLVGIAPENIANILSVTASIMLLFSVIWFNRKFFAVHKYDLIILAAPLLLVLNRTYAAWSTSGMETKLFSFLVFLGIAFLIRGWYENSKYLKTSAVLFAMASLTRPEGILLAASFFVYYLLSKLLRREKINQIIKPILFYVIIIGTHFIFRLVYYGHLFPNTFYAKVEGFWFEAGFSYLFLFIHEYGLYFLLLPVLFVLSKNYDRTRRQILLATTLPFIPYLIYLASIGGDHFEFRPLDIILPFLAIRIQEGFRQMLGWLKSNVRTVVYIVIAAYSLLALMFYTLPGYLSHKTFSNIYESGVGVRTADSSNLLVKFIPGFKGYLALFDNVHAKLAKNFVCVRQEEHKLAMEQYFKPQSEILVDAINSGLIRPDESICLWCVGAIPYYSKLTTIDYLGLTDEHVAHRHFPGQSEKESGLMGHNRRADRQYLLDRGVTYISVRPSVFFFPMEDYFDDSGLISNKLPVGSYLVPFGKYAFIFWSAQPPSYFNRLSRNDIGFFIHQSDGRIIYVSSDSP